MTISAREARRRLFVLLEEVNTDHEPVRITSKAGDAVLMSSDDYDAWQETMHLFRSPENARRLMEAVARDRSGRPRKCCLAGQPAYPEQLNQSLDLTPARAVDWTA